MGDDGLDLDLLRESARSFLVERGQTDSVEDLAAMDWTGLLVTEDLSGAGWRPVEACVIAEELGRAQDRSPWFGCVLVAAALADAPDYIRDRWLPALLKGTAIGGFAVADRTVRVVNGHQVHALVTVGRDAVHLIEAVDTLPRWPDTDSLDINRASWCVDISTAPRMLVGAAAHADRLHAVARLLVSADAIGAFSRTLGRLIDYLRDRVAFGVPIASFQAVQHRLVDLLVFEVKARAIVAKAARALAHGDDAVALAAAAHAFVAAKSTAAVDECMQLSGGIGFTWEYPLHHELRRISADSYLVGTTRTSRALLAEVSGW